jgi:hypothetical protein
LSQSLEYSSTIVLVIAGDRFAFLIDSDIGSEKRERRDDSEVRKDVNETGKYYQVTIYEFLDMRVGCECEKNSRTSEVMINVVKVYQQHFSRGFKKHFLNTRRDSQLSY